MLRVVAAFVLLVASPARAELLGSFGIGGHVAPTRWEGPGDLDPQEIRLSGTSYGLSLPIRLTLTQSLAEPRAFGIVVGVTPTLGGVRLGHTSTFGWFMVETLGRVAFRPRTAWNFQLGAGVAAEWPMGGGRNGVLANDNVEWRMGLRGGIVAVSLTWLGTGRDVTFDLRTAVLTSKHVLSVPVMLCASLEWGRDRPAKPKR